MRRFGGTGDDIPFAPPVMRLHSKAPLRCASERSRSPYTRTGGLCPGANPEFQRVARQNPPVLLPLERLCPARKHPLSSVSGRQRYNTLDLASKIVCHETAGFIGFFLPRQLCRLWKPLPRGAGRQWRPQSVCDTLKHRPSRQARPLSPLESPANRAFLTPIGNPAPKELPSLWNPSPF